MPPINTGFADRAGISTHAVIVHGVVAFSSGSVAGTGFSNPSPPARKCPLNGPYSGGRTWYVAAPCCAVAVNIAADENVAASRREARRVE
jgi:hypothetical protein